MEPVNQISLNLRVLMVLRPPSVTLSLRCWITCGSVAANISALPLSGLPHLSLPLWSLWRVVRNRQPNQSQSPSLDGAESAIGDPRPSVAGSLVVRSPPTLVALPLSLLAHISVPLCVRGGGTSIIQRLFLGPCHSCLRDGALFSLLC